MGRIGGISRSLGLEGREGRASVIEIGGLAERQTASGTRRGDGENVVNVESRRG